MTFRKLLGYIILALVGLMIFIAAVIDIGLKSAIISTGFALVLAGSVVIGIHLIVD